VLIAKCLKKWLHFGPQDILILDGSMALLKMKERRRSNATTVGK
jgi:hypothetical protein